MLEGSVTWPMKERKCVECGVNLSDEDVMKLIFEDGSCEIIPFSRCSNCFKKELLNVTQNKKDKNKFQTWQWPHGFITISS